MGSNPVMLQISFSTDTSALIQSIVTTYCQLSNEGGVRGQVRPIRLEHGERREVANGGRRGRVNGGKESWTDGEQKREARSI